MLRDHAWLAKDNVKVKQEIVFHPYMFVMLELNLTQQSIQKITVISS